MVQKALSLFLFVMFLIFGALQFNDPDPEVWVSIYFFAALLCIMDLSVWNTSIMEGMAKVHPNLPKTIIGFGIFASLLGAGILWPEEYQGITGKMDSRPGVELARESLGLIIVATALAFKLFVISRKK